MAESLAARALSYPPSVAEAEAGAQGGKRGNASEHRTPYPSPCPWWRTFPSSSSAKQNKKQQQKPLLRRRRRRRLLLLLLLVPFVSRTRWGASLLPLPPLFPVPVAADAEGNAAQASSSSQQHLRRAVGREGRRGHRHFRTAQVLRQDPRRQSPCERSATSFSSRSSFPLSSLFSSSFGLLFRLVEGEGILFGCCLSIIPPQWMDGLTFGPPRKKSSLFSGHFIRKEKAKGKPELSSVY